MKIVRSRAPLRLGLAGGGTDLDVYCNNHIGNVLNATISLYTHCTITENNSNNISFKSLDINESIKFSLGEKLSFDGKMDLYKGIYIHLRNKFNLKEVGFSLVTYSDVVSGSGLGGSSTLVVTIIKAFSLFFNLNLSKKEIAEIAFKVEREDIGIIGGSQDQYASSFGGFNFMYFDKKEVKVDPIKLSSDIIFELESSTILYYTGIQRNAGQIEKEKKNLISQKKSIDAMHEIKKNAQEMKNYLINSDLYHFAKKLDETWKNKKRVSKEVSNDKINFIYDLCIQNGAYGGKVSGAGGGGYMFFIIDPLKKIFLTNLLNKQEGLVFNFKFEDKGAHAWIV